MRKWSFVVLIALVATVLGATAFREQVASAAPAILQVFVTNDSSNPVPVTGTVGIQGTPSVNVIDEREPFETRIDVTLASGSFNGSGGFTVPSGKRLVAEFISALVTLPPGQTPLVFVNSLSGAVGFALPLADQGTRATSVGTFEEFTGAQQILDFEA